ncbi:MAG: hypothetical protein JWN71_1705 [Xanthobacteraceae bacterium]|jgi:hypothetical protein|nr:hypothetical protein [Xanthobacteraceae bacterium]
MSRSATWVLATALLAFAVPAGAQQPASGTGVSARGSDVSAQQRPRTRLRVTPLRRAPLDQRAYRQCQDWYETEYRPSGTVIVPKMRCWWVRG